MATNPRAARMAKRILTIVALATESEIKDPALRYVTFTDARMTGDLHDATIFYTVRGESITDEPDHEGAAAALERAKGQLRRIVGAELNVRFTPTLSFTLDSVPETSAHMEEVLRRARQRDEEIRAQAANATPAGDPDPYRS